MVLTKTSKTNGDTSVSSGEITVTNEYEEELEDIPDESVPEGSAPTDPTDPTEDDEIIEIPDDDVPLVDVPSTGDQTMVFVAIAVVSGIAAIFLGKTGKKENEA